ncbi:uncharacterized protein LOC131598566 [Vicia villosa]|uniref:uncharacterized protein LOC131598566 n=1 Tax=Vicia villosa TaxID=3911 RepID=UPI00273BD6F0|nr:uncharacterized protein LOC131598566 [Vicia villosa]
MEDFEGIMKESNFNMGRMYRKLQDYGQKVNWKNLMYGNNARPCTNFILWLACHGRLATKDRLYKFGMTDNTSCCFCPKVESLNHLFFECETMKKIWMEVLQWARINHVPEDWHEEKKWLVHQTKGKRTRAAIIKMAVSETIYELWRIRNNKSFGETVDITKVGRKIIDTLIYRGWYNKKIRNYIAISIIEE